VVVLAVGEVPPAVHRLLVIGHNPDWERLVTWLAGEPVAMGTANAALLEIEAPDWQDLGPGCARLVAIVRPTA
jgi:phosphohistidine phosphatase SixA